MEVIAVEDRDKDFTSLVEVFSFGEAVEEIRDLPPGMLLIDSDGTCRSHIDAMINLKPGLVPEENINMVKKLLEKGWKVAVITNQPYPGHQVAKVVSKDGKRYKAFPFCWEEIGVPVMGGDKNFLTKKYKETDGALQRVVGWVQDNEETANCGNVVFIGDRQGDVDFAKKVSLALETVVKVFKLPGIEDSQSRLVRKMAPLIP